MKKWILASVCALSTWVSIAQQSTEIGYNIGFSNYLGDLQTADYTNKFPGFATGFFVKRNFNPYMAIRGMLNYGRIHGNDGQAFTQGQVSRNLNFRSFILEWGGVLELNLFPFDRNTEKQGRRYFNSTPYFFGGLNVFHFNPKAYYNNQWIALQPLCTEGQNTTFNAQGQYSLTQIAIPFGGGYKFQLNKRFTVGFEIGFRKTFTDYLDDVSGNYVDLNDLAAEKGQLSAELSYRGDELAGFEHTTAAKGDIRGNSSNKDWYTMNTIHVSYKIYSKGKHRF